MEYVGSIANEIVDGNGYVLIPDVLSESQAQEARSFVLKLAEEERQLPRSLLARYSCKFCPGTKGVYSC